MLIPITNANDPGGNLTGVLVEALHSSEVFGLRLKGLANLLAVIWIFAKPSRCFYKRSPFVRI